MQAGITQAILLDWTIFFAIESFLSFIDVNVQPTSDQEMNVSLIMKSMFPFVKITTISHIPPEPPEFNHASI